MNSKSSSLIKCYFSSLLTIRSTHKRISYAHTPGDVPLLSFTAGQLLERAADKNPDKYAFIFTTPGFKITFQQLLQQADNFAAGLKSLGVKRGDRVGIWAPNIPEWLITQYAAFRLGAILVHLNPAYPAPELQYALNLTQTKVLVSASRWKSQDYYSILRSLAPRLADLSVRPNEALALGAALPHLRRLVFASADPPPGSYSVSDVLSLATTEGVRAVRDAHRDINFDDKCNIMFTSGTTGRPKGATLSHHALVNNAYTIGRRFEVHYRPATSRICCPLPLFHSYPATLFSLAVVAHAISGVVPAESFTAESTLRAVESERCTIMYGTPTTYIDMLNHPLVTSSTVDLSSLENGVCGAAPCPISLMRNIIDKLHITKLLIRTSTIGCTLEHLETKLIDKKGRVVPLGAEGEICVRGYSVMLGYWEDEARTREAIGVDGFYRTGDLGVMDADGNLRISGRLKELIVRGGSNIYPAEVEQVLHRHPALQDAQIVGVPDERLGEEVCACVRLKAGVSEPTADDIRKFCREHLTAYKVPKYVLVVDSFPMTLSGKVQKYLLREEAARRLGISHLKTHLELAKS